MSVPDSRSFDCEDRGVSASPRTGEPASYKKLGAVFLIVIACGIAVGVSLFVFEADLAKLVEWAVADLGAAALAGFMVAPFVMAVDKAIAQAASGQASTWQSVGTSMRELISNPVRYVRQPAFFFIWVLYGATYAAANMMSTVEETYGQSMPLAKTAAIFLANSSLALWKDSNFAKLFSDKPPAPVPWPALVSWWVRDFVSMGVIFAAPPLVAVQMEEYMGMKKAIAESVAQFVLPLMLQPFVAPFHLYGYVVYNNPSALWAERKIIMRREIWGAIQMRWLRIIPPFSIGANLNREARNLLISVLRLSTTAAKMSTVTKMASAIL